MVESEKCFSKLGFFDFGDLVAFFGDLFSFGRISNASFRLFVGELARRGDKLRAIAFKGLSARDVDFFVFFSSFCRVVSFFDLCGDRPSSRLVREGENARKLLVERDLTSCLMGLGPRSLDVWLTGDWASLFRRNDFAFVFLIDISLFGRMSATSRLFFVGLIRLIETDFVMIGALHCSVSFVCFTGVELGPALLGDCIVIAAKRVKDELRLRCIPRRSSAETKLSCSEELPFRCAKLLNEELF